MKAVTIVFMMILNKLKHDEGIALPFMAVAAFVIIAAVGLALDSYFATTSKTQYQAAADAAAYAAIEGFLEGYNPSNSDVSTARDDGVDFAISRAKNILEKNVSSMITSGYFENPHAAQADISTSGGASGTITPGIWVAADSGDTRCSPAPCFAAINADADPPEIPNSFKVDIHINPTSQIRTSFMSLLGIKKYSLAARAVATSVARRGAFLIDLSPSIHETSHNSRPESSTGDQQTLYAFPLKSSCSNFDPISESMIFDRIALDSSVSPDSDPRTIFRDLYTPGGPPADRDVLNDSTSYQEDYRCVRVTSAQDTDYDGSTVDKYFGVDVVRKPEPLATIILGVNTALEQFRERSVRGDRVGVFGFDDNVNSFLAVRSTVDSGGVPKLVSPTSATIAGSFTSMIQATETPYRPYQFGTHVPKFLFPQFFSNNDPSPEINPKPLNTDLRKALEFSRDIILSEPGWESSDNFIVVFSDGMSNCMGSSNLGCNAFDKRFNKNAIDSALNYITGTFPPDINLHFVLAGQRVMPHTLMRAGQDLDGDGKADGCLDDFTSRKIQKSNLPSSYKDGFNFINPDRSAANQNGVMPQTYRYPNAFYDAATAASGHWVPLRPPCMQDASSGAPINLLEKNNDTDSPAGQFHRICKTLAPGTVLTSSHLYNQARDTGVYKAIFFPGGGANNRPKGFPWGYLGDNSNTGRLYCDPEGRSIEDQIVDFINQLMAQNPIRLVASGTDGL